MLGLNVILGKDIGLFGDAVLSEEGFEVVVTTYPNLVKLDLGPGVHFDGIDKTNMDPKAVVFLSIVYASLVP